MTTADLLDGIKRFPVPTVCTVLALACFGMYYFRPDLLSELESKWDEVARHSLQMDENLVAGSNLPAHHTEITEKLGELDSRLVRPTELANNLRYFYQLESDTGVTLADPRQSIASAAKDAKAAFVGVNYSFVFSGTFPQVIAYFEGLETGKRLYRFRNFSLQKGRDTERQQLSVAVNLELLGVL